MKATFAKLFLAAFAAEKFATAELADGTKVVYEGDKIDVGTVVTMSTTDPTTNTEKQIPVPGGDHELGGDMAGKIMVVEEGTGKVLELKDKTTQADQTEEAQAAQALIDLLNGFKTQLAEQVKKTEAAEKRTEEALKKVADLAAQFVAGKVDKKKFEYVGNPGVTTRKTDKLM